MTAEQKSSSVCDLVDGTGVFFALCRKEKGIISLDLNGKG